MRKAPLPVRKWIWPQYHLGSSGARLLCQIMGGYSVHGAEHLPAEGGALICPNHLSFLDPPVVGSALPRRTYFMAKKELFQVPIFGPLLYSLYAFPVDREGSDREAIRHAINILRQGAFLTIFIEGGRSSDGSLQEGSLGPALIASRAGVPIIPCCIKETDKILPIGARCLHHGRVQVDFGPPIFITTGDVRLTKADLQAATEKIMQSIEELQQLQYERVGEVAPPRSQEISNAQ